MGNRRISRLVVIVLWVIAFAGCLRAAPGFLVVVTHGGNPLSHVEIRCQHGSFLGQTDAFGEILLSPSVQGIIVPYSFGITFVPPYAAVSGSHVEFVAEQTNLIRNGDFSLTDGGDLLNWNFAVGGAGGYSLDLTEAQVGSNALHMVIGAGDDDWVLSYQNVMLDYPLVHPALLRISSWVQRVGAVEVRISIQFYDASGGILGSHDDLLDLDVEGQWQYMERMHYVPTGTAALQLQLGIDRGNGQVWFDDVGLGRVLDEEGPRSTYPVVLVTHGHTGLAIEAALRTAGFPVVSANDSPPPAAAAWVICSSPSFPLALMDALMVHMESGGDVIFLGGRPFADNGLEFHHIFEDYSLLRMDDVRSMVKVNASASFPLSLEFSGSFSGHSAVAVTFPSQSGFLPLLEGFDAHDRSVGWAGSILINYGGACAGSHWGLFGIEQSSFYEDSQFLDLLVAMLDQFRSGSLLNQMATSETDARSARVQLVAPEPMAIRVSSNGNGFVYEDGTPFFMVGVNICGPSGFRHFAGDWRADVLEAKFQRMQAAGINVVRIRTQITAGMFNSMDRVDALIQFARQYGVYLLIEVGPAPRERDYQAVQAWAELAADRFANEPVVLGFDVHNEPYPWDISTLLLETGQTLGQTYPHNFGRYNRWVDPGSFSMFENLTGLMPQPSDPVLRNDFDNINNMLAHYIQLYEDVLRERDPQALITVGYNNDYIAYPGNAALDFVSNHIYPHSSFPEAPLGYDALVRGLTTMDRLASMWPDRPISIGEFGYSNGMEVQGELLDVYATSVAELVFYLYALANDYSGVMLWQLDDWPLEYIQQRWPNITDTPGRGLRQARFGMYFYDGTIYGRPKPIAHGTSFLRQFVDRGHRGGTLTLYPTDNGTRAGYIYQNQYGLFVGDVRGALPGLSFSSVNGLPVNVMIMWEQGELLVMSTSDAEVTIYPEQLAPGLPSGRQDLLLLAGQVIRI